MRWLVVALAALVVAPQSRDSAVPIESGFTDTVYVQHAALADATAMAWAPDGSNRLFVTLKNGGVRIVKDGVLLGTPFATLSPVFTNSECGLVGICFDPDFASNGLVYFFATVSASEQQILRYTAAGDASTSSRRPRR